MNHYVYEITNLINGKKYIGKRICKSTIEEDRYMGSGILISKAIKKYGKENFRKDILEICDSEELAFEREKCWIKHYNAVESREFYNIKDGGEGNTREDALRNLAKLTPEQIKERSRKLSIANKGKNNSMYGVKGKDNPVSKAIVMMDLEGNIVKEFDCIREANDYFGKDRAFSSISKVCINGGKFQQDSQGLSSDFPIGYIIKDSEIVWATDPTWRSELIGFNKDHKLVLTKATGNEALEMGIRDAVEFGPYFIINGKSMQTVGNGGSGNAPRVAIAQRKDGIVLFLVTNTKFFYGGPTFSEVIETLQKYGAYNAANLDGGSSATLVIENKLINTPRDITTGVINPRGTVSGFCFK